MDARLLPLRIKPLESAYSIRDINGRSVAMVYYREVASVARQANVLTKPEAEAMAKLLARLLTNHLETIKPR